MDSSRFLLRALCEGTWHADDARPSDLEGLPPVERAIVAHLDGDFAVESAQIDEGLRSPSGSAAMELGLLILAARRSQRSQRWDEARRFARIILGRDRQHYEKWLLRAALAECLAISYTLEDYAQYEQLFAEILALRPGRGSAEWLRLQRRHVFHAINQRQAQQARKSLDQLQPYAAELSLHAGTSLEFLEAYFSFSFGLLLQCLAWLDRAPRPDSTSARTFRIMTLVFSGRLEEAERLIDLGPPDVTPQAEIDFETLRGYLALAQRDVERVRRHARQAIAMAKIPAGPVKNALLLLANAELIERRPHEARRLLEQIDPQRGYGFYDMQWSRLYVLEGDFAQAAHYFRKVLEVGMPEYTEDRLRFAYELAAHDVARLWNLASGPLPASAPQPARQQVDIDQVLWVGQSPASQRIRTMISRYASLEATLLITGETGAGKEVAARLVHEQSPRREFPFIPVNCGALSETLIESELFGHVKGAFTGADSQRDGLFVEAGEGTLFLDEIQSMSDRLQSALLRTLENGEIRPVGASKVRHVKARVIAASNQRLEDAVAEGRFRADLYYRLARLQIAIPPLRERPADLPDLVRFFLRSHFNAYDVTCDDSLLAELQSWSWPGNVRELKHTLERLVLLSSDARVLTCEHLQGLVHPTSTMLPPPRRQAKPPATPHSLPGNPRNPRVRRARLRQHFDEYNSLSRAQVIELLGCAPDTASRDLAALVDEGLIRRVNTSAHPRTSYYERI